MPEVGKGKLPSPGELWMLLLWITMAALRVEGVAVNCSLPDHAVEWDEALKGTEVDVEWSYGKAICSSTRECYGADWLPDERMDPQLRPVEIQIGMAVRFRPIKGSGLRFPIHPFRVDYTNFRNCSTNDSLPVIESATEEDFVLADAFLKHGYNYFIVDQYDGLVRCIFGAKLKILVKKKECTAEPGEPFCSGNGHCVSHIMEEKYECSCCHGYTGNFCELVDYCADSPCGDQGNCSLYFGAKYEAGFKCNCSEGYIGDRCETHIDSQCDLDLCENNATCRGNLTHFACFCKPGFTGHLCDVDVNECESSPCGSGMCVDQLNGVQCFCLPGFGGERCEIQYNECDSNPCLNGGFCRDEVDKFSCHCALGYNGSLCEEKLSPCLTNPCRAGAHSACRDSHENFTCICLPGFTGSQCEVDINDCEGDPCQNGGTCKDGVNEFICLCNELFYGKRCEQVDDFMRPSRHNHPLEEETPSMHIHNLYIVGGTLGGALVVALCVLIGCFCRTHRTYETLSRRAGYKRQTDSDFRFASHDVSSVCSPRPSADAIWEATTLNYHSDQLNTPVAQSLKPKKV